MDIHQVNRSATNQYATDNPWSPSEDLCTFLIFKAEENKKNIFFKFKSMYYPQNILYFSNMLLSCNVWRTITISQWSWIWYLQIHFYKKIQFIKLPLGGAAVLIMTTISMFRLIPSSNHLGQSLPNSDYHSSMCIEL